MNESNPKSKRTWKNWSGSVECSPRQLLRPESEEEVAALLRRSSGSGHHVRVVGSGHSFSALCETGDILMSLEKLNGLESVDDESREAVFWAGTSLHALGDPLWEHGLALENMGDIDRQALAGAIATGTHGTGRGLGNLSTQVTGLRMITPNGDVVECSERANLDLFNAARVSLGVLGVVTQVRMRCVPVYFLHEKIWRVPFEQCMEELDHQIQSNRHFEFFWSPRKDLCYMKALNPTDAPPESVTDKKYERIDRSYRIFPTVRDVPFNEVEYAMSEKHGPECVRELRSLMLEKHTDIEWPLEYRTVAADDIWLSPAHGRDTVTISAHQDARLPYQEFFTDAQSVFRQFDGRPHWGKIHSLGAEELDKLYPKMRAFKEVRQRFDPANYFLNDYLSGLFAPSGSN